MIEHACPNWAANSALSLGRPTLVCAPVEDRLDDLGEAVELATGVSRIGKGGLGCGALVDLGVMLPVPWVNLARFDRELPVSGLAGRARGRRVAMPHSAAADNQAAGQVAAPGFVHAHEPQLALLELVELLFEIVAQVPSAWPMAPISTAGLPGEPRSRRSSFGTACADRPAAQPVSSTNSVSNAQPAAQVIERGFTFSDREGELAIEITTPTAG